MLKKKKVPSVAYFCMEYGLDPSWKTYAGGLGILAGDYLKGAKDYQYPVIGIGIKWKQGYGDQMIGKNDYPFDAYHINQFKSLEDTKITVKVKIRNRDVACKVWKTEQFGTVPLYLLDTDLAENEDQWITGQLYGWFSEERVAQEMVLGIGGVRALRQLGEDISVYHFNEGHAAFAGLELIREKIERGLGFKQAWAASKEEIVFTTHTPVVQGNEEHTLERLMYMGVNNELTPEQLVKIGGAPFNLTVAALRLSRNANAVAALHGETAHKMWSHVEERAPIISITNAIHLPTWVDEAILQAVEAENDEQLWESHRQNKLELINFIKEKNAVELDPEVLLIGFARRAVGYKRSDLIFSDEEVIKPLLKDKKLQLVFSGKSHPLDDHGKEIIARLVKFSRVYPESVVFLENYDMTIAKNMTRGADVWLNNPRRPLEASGTSGMKAAMNGVLNCSILDGWWPEVCEHGVNGWQFGNGFESDDPKVQDKHDLKALYQVIQREIIPAYYNQRPQWIKMMRQSVLATKEKFSMKRMLDEYFQKLYRK
jgi:starch phosphorylase